MALQFMLKRVSLCYINSKLVHPASHGVHGMFGFLKFYCSLTIWTVALLFELCTCALAIPQGTVSKPFSVDEITRLLKGDVSQNRIAELAQERGIDFPITPETEAEFRQAGANEALLAVFRMLVPKSNMQPRQPTLVVTTSPGRANVYVDDELMGTTSLEGQLKIFALAPGRHHLRIDLNGYLDSEQDAELIAGRTISVDVRLSVQPSARPPEPQPAEISKSVEAAHYGPEFVSTGEDALVRFPVAHEHGQKKYCLGYLYFSRSKIRYQAVLLNGGKDHSFDLLRSDLRYAREWTWMGISEHAAELDFRTGKHRFAQVPRSTLDTGEPVGELYNLYFKALIEIADNFDGFVAKYRNP
jgi:hypothetical protein